MTDTVIVETPRGPDAERLGAFLAGHGLIARRRGTALDVSYAPPDPLGDTVDHALAAWVSSHGRDLVPVRVGPHRVALRPPAG